MSKVQVIAWSDLRDQIAEADYIIALSHNEFKQRKLCKEMLLIAIDVLIAKGHTEFQVFSPEPPEPDEYTEEDFQQSF